VLGDGLQRKPYLHVSELVDAMMFITRHASGALNFYNVSGNDNGATVRFIAETVVAEASAGMPIHYTGGAKGWVGDIPNYHYSTEKLRNLGWRPAMTSEQAVQQAVREIYREICRP
jgi:UDP-glucose 4-epimerase